MHLSEFEFMQLHRECSRLFVLHDLSLGDLLMSNLSTMIENTWTWAKQHGKVYTHQVNKAEYVDLDVDTTRERQNQRSTEIESSSAFVTEDWGRLSVGDLLLRWVLETRL